MAAEEKKDESESSGLTDILELAATLGTDDEDDSGFHRSADTDDHSGPVGPGYGGVAGAALVSGDEDDAPEAAPPPKAKAETAPPKPKPAPAPKKATTPEPVAKPSPAAPAAASSSAPSSDSEDRKGGMMLWIVAGAAVALGAVWFATRGGDEPQPQAVPAAAVAKADPEVDKPKPPPPPAPVEPAVAVVPEPESPQEVEEPEETVEVEEESAQEPETEPAVVASARAGRKRDKANGAPKAKPEPTNEPPAEEPPPPPPPEPIEPKEPSSAPVDEGKFSSECLLNPNKPGCAEFRKRRELDKKNLDATLPDKLSLPDIRKAISPHKNKAKACGTKHGVEPGTTVRVKLSIAGDTGNVISATANAPHDTQPVGQCVANIFKNAKFPRFKSQQQGAVYPLRM